MTNYEVVIGLEVHAQLKTQTKLFCRCANAFGRAPNSLTCPVCLALPGALPVANRDAVRFAIKAGLAVGCTINPRSVFARKNYFYPDLPKGYQISQFDQPICVDGALEFGAGAARRTVRIQRIHMEEDAGKLIHGDNLLNKEGSLVDLNRAGVPLIEIVSHPDLRDPAEAAEYLRQLRSILRYVDVCDGNMEEGSLRCDANVSLRPVGQKEFGTRVEIKNMNSFKNVQKAIEYEIERQRQTLESGQKVVQETRLWNPDRGVTASMRSKEEAHDYRYFPDPDLLPLELDSAWIEEIRGAMEELPAAKKARLVRDLGLPEYDAGILTAEKETADYFERALELFAKGAPDGKKAKAVSNYVMGDILALCNERSTAIQHLSITPERLAGLLDLIEKGTISGKIAKDVILEMVDSTKSAADIVAAKGLGQISDPEAIRAMIRAVMDANAPQVADFRAGKEKILGYLVGQVMKAAKGQANPGLLNQILLEELKRGV